MKKIILIFLAFIFCTSVLADSRFGELTEMFDEKMRGKDNQWVRPHPGPFVWNKIEKKQGNFSWQEADEYVEYAQKHNQKIIATIWPYANWEQKSCKRKKARSPFGKHFSKYLSKPCSMDNYKNFLLTLIDRYDGDGSNDMPGLTKPITYWEIMNEPEYKMFFRGTKDEFIEIFNFSSKIIKEKQKDSVIIMAGGEGSRLKPFTSVLPKPLIPVHGKPIIQHIIEKFSNKGMKNFHVAINYKGQILKAFLNEFKNKFNFTYIEEKTPLGTAGSLSLLKKVFDTPFFVTNCDILVDIDFEKILHYHNDGKFDITLVASAKQFVIPYGACRLNSEGYLSSIDEKPQYDFLINTGLYVLNPDLLKLIPKNKFYHITHLIEDAKNQGKKIGVFPVDDDDWIDVGQWAEYKKVIDKF